MRISVIIPVRNEERYIGTCLSCLVEQTISKNEFEVIVVDNGSTDRSLEVIDSFRGRLSLAVLKREGGTIAALRNLGAAAAKGEILSFLDGDCYAEQDWLSLAAQKAPAGDGIWGAHYRLTEDATWVSRTWNAYQATEVEGETSFIPSGNLFIKNGAFRKLHGFDESIATSEDVDICSRARHLRFAIIAYKALSVRHAGFPRTLLDFYRKNRWHGTNVIPNFIRNLPSVRYAGVVGLSLYTFLSFWCLVGSLFFIVHHPVWPAASLIALVFPPVVLGAWRSRFRSWADAIRLMILYQTYLLARAAAILRRAERPR